MTAAPAQVYNGSVSHEDGVVSDRAIIIGTTVHNPVSNTHAV
jgi:hypothetical protein